MKAFSSLYPYTSSRTHAGRYRRADKYPRLHPAHRAQKCRLHVYQAENDMFDAPGSL